MSHSERLYYSVTLLDGLVLVSSILLCADDTVSVRLCIWDSLDVVVKL